MVRESGFCLRGLNTIGRRGDTLLKISMYGIRGHREQRSPGCQTVSRSVLPDPFKINALRSNHIRISQSGPFAIAQELFIFREVKTKFTFLKFHSIPAKCVIRKYFFLADFTESVEDINGEVKFTIFAVPCHYI
jgi:hypothetical protein